MIYFTTKKADLMQQDIIVLEYVDKDGVDKASEGYVIVSRRVYNAALILSDRCAGSIDVVTKKVGQTDHAEAVDYFYSIAPEPIYILAPFLALAEKDADLPKDFETLCGYLHMMSMSIDFEAFINAPVELRGSIRFTKRQLEIYKDSWKDMSIRLKFMELDTNSLTVEFVQNLLQGILPLVGTIPVEREERSAGRKKKNRVTEEEEEEESDEENSNSESDAEEADKEEPEDIWASLGEFLEAEEAADKDKEEVQTPKAPDVHMNDESSSDAATDEKKEIDAIIARFGG